MSRKRRPKHPPARPAKVRAPVPDLGTDPLDSITRVYVVTDGFVSDHE